MPISGSYYYPGVSRGTQNFKLPQYLFANLPAGSDSLSGSVVWVSDRKSAAIYGPQRMG
jgi:hypothetical protein